MPKGGNTSGEDYTSSTNIDVANAIATEGSMSVKDQCVRYGDFSIFEHCPELGRDDLKHVDFLTLHPGELYNTVRPEVGYKPYWHLMLVNNLNSMRDLLYLKRRGFYLANANDGFVCAVVPAQPDGAFTYGGLLVLMVQEQDTYHAEQIERNVPAKYIVQRAREEFHAEADKHGIGTFEGESSDENGLDQSAYRPVVSDRR